MPGGFSDLLCWKEAIRLLEMIAALVLGFRGPDGKKAAAQLLSAAESISANIAEGYGKGFVPDNCRFLRIAIASADEVESRLNSSIAAGRVRRDAVELHLRQVRRTRSLTQGYMAWVARRAAELSTG